MVDSYPEDSNVSRFDPDVIHGVFTPDIPRSQDVKWDGIRADEASIARAAILKANRLSQEPLDPREPHDTRQVGKAVMVAYLSGVADILDAQHRQQDLDTFDAGIALEDLAAS
jgi:hypothetical protein